MRFAFKTSPQDTTWTDMLAVWKAADDIELFESGGPSTTSIRSFPTAPALAWRAGSP